MIILRSARNTDYPAVLRLAHQLNSYNLPYDEKIIRDLIHSSERSFCGKRPKAGAKYLFVMENTSSKDILGASLIIARQGTRRSPHIYFEKKGIFLRFGSQTHGPTEIGGLILKKKYRGKKEKLGKQLSWVRFLYMAQHLQRFERNVLVEFLPPFHSGKSVFWEAVGKRFTGLSYREADRLSVYTKKFIFDCFPRKINMRHLPKKAQKEVGKVSPQAKGACALLTKIGFRKTNRIEPFDGGPYYEAPLRKIAVIQKVQKVRFAGHLLRNGKKMLFLMDRKGKVRAAVGLCETRGRNLFMDRKTIKTFQPRRKESILCVPF